MHADGDPAIVAAPWGDEVDGRRLLRETVGFGRALRAAGLAVDLGAAVDYARALPLVDVGEREQVRAAGEAVFVRRRDDREIYDAVFDRWWRQRGRRQGDFAAPPLPRPSDEEGLEGEATGQAEPAPRRGAGRVATRPAGRADPVGRRRRQRGRRRHRGRGRRARRLLARRDAAPPRVRPDDPGRAARRRAAGRRADPAPRAAPDPPLRAAFPRPASRPAGDVPPEPGHRRAAADVGLAAAGEGAALAGRAVRHLGLDGAALAAPAALRAGAFGVVGGARRVVRLRDAAHPGHAAAARQGPRPRARPGRGHRQRLGRRHADRRELPDVQPEVGPAVVALERRRDRRVGRLGSRRSGARGVGDGPPAPQLPSARVAEPAGRHARIPAPRRRDARGLPVHRRLPAGRDRRVARAARRDPGRRPFGRHATGQRGGRPRGTPRGGRGGRSPARRRDAAPPTVVGGPPSDRNAARPIR